MASANQNDDPVVRYRANRSHFVYYSIAVAALLFGLGLMGHGCLNVIGPEENATYLRDPTCAEGLLLDGADHLTTPCAILETRVLEEQFENDGHFGFLVTRSKPQLGRFARKMPDSFDAHVRGWKGVSDNERVRLQIYDNGKDYLVAKLYDPVEKGVRETVERPRSRGEASRHELKIGLGIVAVCLLWIFLGRFMRFAE